jgi:hypothetical protein
MATPDYSVLLDNLLRRMTDIVHEKSNLDAEAEKILQLLHATVNMLPDDERNVILGKWTEILKTQSNRDTSLIDSVRKILQEAHGQWLTVAEVRNRVVAAGFDFSDYISNPLASISSTLTRLKDKKEAACNTVEGVKVYRWKKRATKDTQLALPAAKSSSLDVVGSKKE